MPEDQKPIQSEVPAELSQPVEEADSIAARTRPAVFVDAFLVESGEHLFRITLGEGRADTRDRIRFAFMMPTEDVRELVKILNNLLAKTDAEKTSDKA